MFRPPCGPSRKAIHSLLRRARRGSRTKQHREVVRDGPQGPERKVDRGCGRNRDELGEFFLVLPGPAAVPAAPRISPDLRSPAMHPPRPPSIDQGIIALLWAIGLAVFIYFGLIAVGASAATAIVLALVSFAGIWFFVRLRGEDMPARRRRRP